MSFFIAEFDCAEKNQKDHRLTILNIFSSPGVRTVQRSLASQQKVIKYSKRSKSIKLVTSYDGHIDGMNK